MMDISLAVDPVNLIFIAFFGWLTYASGWGKVMWIAVKSNNYGFARRIKPMGMVTEEDRLK